jgi:hypothetical protein
MHLVSTMLVVRQVYAQFCMGNHFLPKPYCKTINEDDAYIIKVIKGNCNIPPATQFSYTPLLPTNFPFQFLFYMWTPLVSNCFLFFIFKVKSASVFNHTHAPFSPPDPTQPHLSPRRLPPTPPLILSPNPDPPTPA